MSHVWKPAPAASRSALSIAGSVLSWLILGLLLLLLLALVAVPALLGWVPLTVLSGSMEPTIRTGSQVVVSPVDTPEKIATLQSGDIITYLPRPEDPSLITHRITAVSVSEDGTRTFTTQGDANSSADEPVTEQMIRGELRYHVPWVGYAANALTGQQKNIGIVVLAAALFGYAGWQILRAFGERRRAAAPKPRRAVVE